jgi:hypothetical protein
VDKVVFDRGEHDVALSRIVWRGGAVSDVEVKMKVNSVAKLAQVTEMGVVRTRVTRSGGLTPPEQVTVPCFLGYNEHGSKHWRGGKAARM